MKNSSGTIRKVKDSALEIIPSVFIRLKCFCFLSTAPFATVKIMLIMTVTLKAWDDLEVGGL